MSYKDILVYVDNTPAAQARVAAAATIASSFGAHLTGLCVPYRPHMPPMIEARLGEHLIKLQEDVLEEWTEAAKNAFDKATANSGLALEWRVVEGEPEEILCLHGRYADLIVIGQHDPSIASENPNPNLADHLTMAAGRPVMVIPHSGRFASIGKQVMVAWNASRESARAVSDALPFLKAAKQVRILAVNPHCGLNGHGEAPGADIALHLARHGVKATAECLAAEDISAADLLLARAADEDIDLIVMGCYGRSRLREMVMGGATRHMLAHMTLPVLMAH
jgi:nucleotide-binding universal stress UspA family protein